MSIEKNKEVVRRFVQQVWSHGNLDAIDQLCSSDFIGHDFPDGFPSTADGLKQLITMYHAAFPDMFMSVEDVIADGDRVVVRWKARGTHQGNLLDIPPSGRQTLVSGIDIYRLANGKITETWGQFDQMCMVQCLGAVPSPA